MARTIIGVLLAFAAPALADAHPSTRPLARCFVDHPGATSYCRAVAVRRALGVLREGERTEARRSGSDQPGRRRFSWRLAALERALAWHRAELARLRALPAWPPTTVRGAVCALWRPCDGALAVFSCESHLTTTAQNGQYLGLAQMGEFARSHYGHGSDAWTQAKAAYAYWRDAGWSPWTCATIVGVR